MYSPIAEAKRVLVLHQCDNVPPSVDPFELLRDLIERVGDHDKLEDELETARSEIQRLEDDHFDTCDTCDDCDDIVSAYRKLRRHVSCLVATVPELQPILREAPEW